jgi:two-component system phosphate regulon sensor histidine kinase PhoR
MLERRSLRAPITLGVVMILLVVALAIGWIAISIGAALDNQDNAPVYYALLAIGSVGLAVVLAGVIAYLTLTVKAINLNRRQSNFIDSVTHELKSPIASLKLYLQTLARRSVDAQQSKEFHRYMLEDVERLDQLINHLLDAARIERDSKPAELETVRLDEILRHGAIAAAVRYAVPSETVMIESPQLWLRSRAIELDILFRNLIDNAVKYGGSPPLVKIVASTISGNRVVVRVSDNGAGIPPNLRRKIFGRFVRLGSELERSKPGTGLGLYLVRTVTRSLGGSIQIDYQEQQQGTVFIVTLPGVVTVAADPAIQLPDREVDFAFRDTMLKNDSETMGTEKR